METSFTCSVLNCACPQINCCLSSGAVTLVSRPSGLMTMLSHDGVIIDEVWVGNGISWTL
jgi:hypothetical protein